MDKNKSLITVNKFSTAVYEKIIDAVAALKVERGYCFANCNGGNIYKFNQKQKQKFGIRFVSETDNTRPELLGNPFFNPVFLVIKGELLKDFVDACLLHGEYLELGIDRRGLSKKRKNRKMRNETVISESASSTRNTFFGYGIFHQMK